MHNMTKTALVWKDHSVNPLGIETQSLKTLAQKLGVPAFRPFFFLFAFAFAFALLLFLLSIFLQEEVAQQT